MKALLNNQDTLVAKSMDVIKNRATELLKKERVVIVDAYCCGDMDYNKVALPGTRAEEYFNETFGQ